MLFRSLEVVDPLAADKAVVQDLGSRWYPEFSHARARPRHESVLGLIGFALLGVSAIAASAYQGLALPPPSGSEGQTAMAWAFGVAGLFALAFVIRNLVQKILVHLK